MIKPFGYRAPLEVVFNQAQEVGVITVLSEVVQTTG